MIGSRPANRDVIRCLVEVRRTIANKPVETAMLQAE